MNRYLFGLIKILFFSLYILVIDGALLIAALAIGIGHPWLAAGAPYFVFVLYMVVLVSTEPL